MIVHTVLMRRSVIVTHFVPRLVLVSVSALALVGLAACGGGDSAPLATDPVAGVETTGSTPASVDPVVSAPTTAPTTASTTTASTTTVATMAHLRGTAYTFNTPDPIAGATIRVEELPDVSAVTAADGSYELAVPVGSTVTAYIEAPGHHSIHVQTFTLDDAHDGVELDGVNFQTPADAIYDGLRALMTGIVGKDPFEGGCAIVTTVGDARMVGMSFAEFIEFHPHGIEGATAALVPAAVDPIYFNDDVVPDPTQELSSIDGGVIWVNVPPGTYQLQAEKPGTEFVTVNVRCEQDWVVNANPVWGLHAVP